MGYNAVLDHLFTDEAATEPVSLTDFKRHLNMIFDSEGSYEFNDDDTYLMEVLSDARRMVEEFTRTSVIARTVTAILRNDCGGIELPYGPVNDISSVVDKDDQPITGYVIMGIQFKWLECPKTCYAKVVYTAGYSTLPGPLKRAILEQGAWLYKNRGDQQQEFASGNVSLCESALNAAAPYKRSGFLV